MGRRAPPPRIGAMADATAAVELDGQYRAIREGAGMLDRSERGKLLVRGADAADYLQSQVTNDIEALEPDQGCYAALLDRKGHFVADMTVLCLSHSHAGDIWLDTEPAALEPLRKHLETYKIGRAVEVVDESKEWAISSLIGSSCSPRAPSRSPKRPPRSSGSSRVGPDSATTSTRARCPPRRG